ncbi:MAG: nitrogen fixation protein NifZ [Rhodocyclaceae bacterium]
MHSTLDAKYRIGQPVAARIDLFNDGSHPSVPDEQLLVSAGTRGEVMRVGFIEEAATVLYIVEFAPDPRHVVGVLEHELAPV